MRQAIGVIVETAAVVDEVIASVAAVTGDVADPAAKVAEGEAAVVVVAKVAVAGVDGSRRME